MEDRVRARRDLQLSRELLQMRPDQPHPSRGGSRGCPTWHREEQLEKHASGEPIEVSAASISRWKNRLHPHWGTGNKDKTEPIGADLALLAICFTIHPQATMDEMAMLIHRENGHVHSSSLISKRLKELNITSKRASIEACQACAPHNRRRECLFWNSGHPLGVVGTPRRRLIDVDEFAVEFKSTNRNKGWAPSFVRVRNVGSCTKNQKLTVMTAVEAGDPSVDDDLAGSIAHPRRWVSICRLGGTTGDDFARFFDDVCTRLEGVEHIPGTDDERIFMWDNPGSHCTPIICQTVEGRGDGRCTFRIIPRPAHQPKCGPMECAICQVINWMKINALGELSLDSLGQQMQKAVGKVGPFDPALKCVGCSIDGNC